MFKGLLRTFWAFVLGLLSRSEPKFACLVSCSAKLPNPQKTCLLSSYLCQSLLFLGSGVSLISSAFELLPSEFLALGWLISTKTTLSFPAWCLQCLQRSKKGYPKNQPFTKGKIAEHCPFWPTAIWLKRMSKATNLVSSENVDPTTVVFTGFNDLLQIISPKKANIRCKTRCPRHQKTFKIDCQRRVFAKLPIARSSIKRPFTKDYTRVVGSSPRSYANSQGVPWKLANVLHLAAGVNHTPSWG